jgi:hypothetical protein
MTRQRTDYTRVRFAQRKFSAMPPDVRKAFGFRQVCLLDSWAMPNWLGQSPEFITNRNGSAERSRTSGGIAESRVNEDRGQA